MEPLEWKSPRKLAEEERLAARERFERYMEMSDEGLMERDVALDALRDILGTHDGSQVPVERNQVA